MKLFVLLFLLITIGCNDKREKKLTPVQKIEYDHLSDSIFQSAITEAAEKPLTKVVDCPLKITKFWVTHNSIGTPEANLNIKNNGKKIVDGLKVGILCYNNFDEPVSKSITGDNTFRGISQERLRPGKTESDTWTLYLFDNTTKIKPYLYEVHFTDGTKWELP